MVHYNGHRHKCNYDNHAARPAVYAAHMQIPGTVRLANERLDAAIEAEENADSEDLENHVAEADDGELHDVAGVADEEYCDSDLEEVGHGTDAERHRHLQELLYYLRLLLFQRISLKVNIIFN